jgi:hypothetical protein
VSRGDRCRREPSSAGRTSSDDPPARADHRHPHHAYFVDCLQKDFQLSLIVQTVGSSNQDPIRAQLELDTRRFEEERWFQGRAPSVCQIAPAVAVHGINSDEALRAVLRTEADVAVTFGTGILSGTTLSELQDRRLNLHGGDPERYREIDFHLWSLYHGDESGLVTALHLLEEDGDASDIVAGQSLDVAAAESIEQLRSINTEAATRLVLHALVGIDRFGDVPSRRQRNADRYYSALPGQLVGRCRNSFRLRWEARP